METSVGVLEYLDSEDVHEPPDHYSNIMAEPFYITGPCSKLSEDASVLKDLDSEDALEPLTTTATSGQSPCTQR